MTRAYVIGNVAIDDFFRVDRLPTSGASILGRRRRPDLGGKGANQAIVLARCGIETVLITATGQDPEAERIAEGLAPEPLDTRVITLPDCATDVSVVLTEADGTNAIVTSNACAGGIGAEAVLHRLTDARPDDLALFQGNLRPEVTLQLMHACAERGMTVVLNPSPVDQVPEAALGRAGILFLNEVEAATFTDAQGAEAIARLRDRGTPGS